MPVFRYLAVFFNFFLLHSTLCSASGDVASLSKSAYWEKLVHYKKGLFGGLKSEAAGSDFFLSPEGRADPEAEMNATIAAFSSDRKIGPHLQDAQCAFPERYRYLKKELNLAVVDVKCAEYDLWRQKLNGKSVSLIFSSFFSGSPGSMFGHTFLRINSGTSEQLDVLDFSTDFSAWMGENTTPLKYVIYGLLGQFPGRYSVMPYYIKVKEYNNSENRDLYEYTLGLNEQEVDRLLAHLWELLSTHFDYYFFDKNCSYQILTLLEVAKPEWDLSSHFFYPVIPPDTIKVIAREKGAIVSVKQRPALTKRLHQKWDVLTEEERDSYFAVLRHEKNPSEIRSAPLAEALNLHFAGLQIQNKGELPSREALLYRKILLARASQTSEDRPLGDFKYAPPHLSHHSARAGFSYGWSGDQKFEQLSWRAAMHDLFDEDLGFNPWSQIEVLAVKLRWYNTPRRLTLDQFKFVELVSLIPIHALAKPPSFRLAVILDSPRDIRCDFCRSMNFEGGIGYSLGAFQDRAVFYSLLQGQVQLASEFEKGWRFGPAPTFGFIAGPFRRYKAGFAAKWNFFPTQTVKDFFDFSFQQSFSFSQSSALRFEMHRFLKHNEGLWTINWYF